MEVTRLGPNPPAFADALKSVNHGEIVNVLQGASVETALQLQKRGVLKNSQSVIIAVIPSEDSDLSNAVAYHRVSLQTEASTVKFDK